MKKCKRCKKLKLSTEFYPCKNSADGFQYECKNCAQKRNHLYRKLCKASGLMNYSQRTRQRLRLEVLKHYGGDKPVCSCCGEHRIEFLSLDHINGGGLQHRKRIGSSLYDWLKKNKFPDLGLRVLCHNCNQSYGAYGYCPHKNPNARPYCPPIRQYTKGFGKKSKRGKILLSPITIIPM